MGQGCVTPVWKGWPAPPSTWHEDHALASCTLLIHRVASDSLHPRLW